MNTFGRATLCLALLLVVGCKPSPPSGEVFIFKAENADFKAFSGQMTVKGSYYRMYEDVMTDGDVTCFSPDAASVKKIAISSLKQGGFCFDNPGVANELLELNGARDPKVCQLGGDAEIIIADYTVDKHPNHPEDTAKIKGVIASTATEPVLCDQ